jgi:DNA-binding transcriptional ArsR family regulator
MSKAKTQALDYGRIAGRYQLAANPLRLAILIRLAEGEQHLRAMWGDLGAIVTPPAISYHLSLLQAAGFVEARREGNRRVYSLTGAGRGIVELAEVAGATIA